MTSDGLSDWGTQVDIRELLDILNDPETDEDDREMTLITLADVLDLDMAS